MRGDCPKLANQSCFRCGEHGYTKRFCNVEMEVKEVSVESGQGTLLYDPSGSAGSKYASEETASHMDARTEDEHLAYLAEEEAVIVSRRATEIEVADAKVMLAMNKITGNTRRKMDMKKKVQSSTLPIRPSPRKGQ